MRSLRRLAMLLVPVVLVLYSGESLHAQDTGTIRGTVTSSDGSAVSGAQVFVEGTNVGTLTNPEGRYVLERVPAGTQTVRVRFIGLRPGVQQVDVPAGQAVTADFTLEVDALQMTDIVVTGTRTPERKIESSTAITTVSARQIRERQPRSTADMVKVVPGFYVESSGGEVGGNLFARGLPADGSYRYVALMEDGMPVYGATELSFVNADIFVRLDENIENVEAVRGGNSALFGSNAPGGVVNFLSRTGGPEMAGSMQATVGTDGLTRYDLNVNGPIAEDWRFNIGGFYRYDDGIRDPDFPASRGGQLKANLTRLLDNGYLRVHAKYLNDRNTFFLPLPIQGAFDEDGDLTEIDFVQGFPHDGTLTSREGVGLRVPLPRNNGDLTIPLDDGQRQNGVWFMAEASLDMGDGWNLQNKLRYMDVAHTWNALLPFDLVNANQWAQGFVDETPGGAGFQLLCTNVLDGEGDKAAWGSAACPRTNDFANLAGLWHIDLPMTDLSNQLQVTRTLEAGNATHEVTVGSFFSHYTADNRWHFNNVLTDVRNRPHFLDLAITDDGGNVIRQVTDDGFRQYLDLYVNGRGNATVAAFFAGDRIEFDGRWRLDLGARYEYNKFEVDSENTAGFDVGETDAEQGVNFGTGTFRRVNIDFHEWAASVGVNYSLTEESAVYVRGSRGYKMPILSNYLFDTDPSSPSFFNEAEELWQAEGGLKYGSPRLGLSAVGYVLFISNFPSQDVQVVDGETVFVSAQVGEARTLGLELEAVAQPVDGFQVNAILTAQNPEYTEFFEGEEDLSGNRVRRIPQILWELTGEYTYERLSARASWNFIGHRFSNNQNTIALPEYSVFDASANYQLGSGIRFTAAVKNILDGNGLTEGNPRLDESLGGLADVFLARPVLPRRFQVSVGYDF